MYWFHISRLILILVILQLFLCIEPKLTWYQLSLLCKNWKITSWFINFTFPNHFLYFPQIISNFSSKSHLVSRFLLNSRLTSLSKLSFDFCQIVTFRCCCVNYMSLRPPYLTVYTRSSLIDYNFSRNQFLVIASWFLSIVVFLRYFLIAMASLVTTTMTQDSTTLKVSDALEEETLSIVIFI